MKSTDICSILATKTFVQPSKKSLRLDKWFQEKIHDYESQVLSETEEQTFWTDLVMELFNACTTKKAKQYVWGQFALAQYPLETHLYKAGYAWLLEHQDAATPKTRSILEWSQQEFSKYSLLGAVCELPSKPSISYITSWIKSLQNRNGILPTVLAREYQNLEKKDLRRDAQANEHLWKDVLIPALPHIKESVKDVFRAPYLPCLYSPRLKDTLFIQIPESLHSWVMVNLLSSTNFYVKAIFDSDYASEHLQNHIDPIDNPKMCAYLAWDLLHRIDDPYRATAIIERHCPTLSALVQGLSIADIQELRDTVAQFWKMPVHTPVLQLPTDFNHDTF